jgi:hypothetical protein
MSVAYSDYAFPKQCLQLRLPDQKFVRMNFYHFDDVVLVCYDAVHPR